MLRLELVPPSPGKLLSCSQLWDCCIYIYTSSSYCLLEWDFLKTYLLFTGQEKSSSKCSASHVKLQLYWIPMEKSNHQPVFKILVLPWIEYGYYNILSSLSYIAWAFYSPISLQHPRESWPPDLISTMFFSNTLLISLLDEMSSKLHTRPTSLWKN